MAEKNSSEKTPREPSKWLYFLACLYAKYIYGKKYNIVFDNVQTRGLKGPALVLSNHESNRDFLICAAALYPLRLNFMVSTYFFHHRLLSWLLRLMGCIPKRQYLPDAAAVKSVMKAAARGARVCIFPEGQVCFSGQSSDIDLSTAKLAKRLGLPLIIHSIRGNYLTAPKWARGKQYRGRIESRTEILYGAEELRSLPLETVARGIKEALSYDEFVWQRETMAAFKPERRETAGLETILYRCPACGSDLAMLARGESLVCERCGYEVSFNEYGFFKAHEGAPVFDSVSEWYRFELECAAREYAGSFSFSMPCTLHRTVEGRQGYEPCGAGLMTADERGLHFKGERLKEPFELSALVERQSNITHNASLAALDIEGPDANYALRPEDSRAMGKFIVLYLLAAKRAQG
ncbi:MAG: lysophospholipid acyltransferase family protein [Oscillospiraceae bacterium]|nr:lysophospholipid acyltransferase family protein [Oscillospiraceae bacterium]